MKCITDLWRGNGRHALRYSEGRAGPGWDARPSEYLRACHPGKRHAFTLVELLVVIALIGLLAGLIAFAMPGFRDRSRAARGGQAVQGALSYARQQALLHQSPRGLRLLFKTQQFDVKGGPIFNMVVTECQYLERPDDYVGPPLTQPKAPVVPVDFLANEVRVGTGGGSVNFSDSSVEVGDILEVLDSGKIHYIVDIKPSNPTTAPTVFDKLILSSNVFPNTGHMIPDTSPITNYRIIRKPRVTGDEAVKLPGGIVIDVSLTLSVAGVAAVFPGGYTPTNDATDKDLTKVPPFLGSQGFIDIMFGPSGAVLEPTTNPIILWVRLEPQENEINDPYAYNPTLIVVYPHTGAVAAFDPVNGSPFARIQ